MLIGKGCAIVSLTCGLMSVKKWRIRCDNVSSVWLWYLLFIGRLSTCSKRTMDPLVVFSEQRKHSCMLFHLCEYYNDLNLPFIIIFVLNISQFFPSAIHLIIANLEHKFIFWRLIQLQFRLFFWLASLPEWSSATFVKIFRRNSCSSFGRIRDLHSRNSEVLNYPFKVLPQTWTNHH